MNQMLAQQVIEAKKKGLSDKEIGDRYSVNLKLIEKAITREMGINVSNPQQLKKTNRRMSPRTFQLEKNTIWSFKSRGNWATHNGNYRGNWSPYIPRNVILRYSKESDLVLDYFCGAGTTAIECKLLHRNFIGVDINPRAIELAEDNLDFEDYSLFEEKFKGRIDLRVGDARKLAFFHNDSIDLICAHPPYSDIIQYTDSKRGDLSFLGIEEFLKEMSEVARESFRVLKPGRQCAILIGDMRKKKHVIPLGFRLINTYLDAGFKLKELVIKRQHNCKTTGFWYANSIKYNFLLLAHEYLPIFEKPKSITFGKIKEARGGYGLLAPTLEKPQLKRKLDGLETTTVWVFPEKDFEKRLNKNVIDRYADGKGYSTVTIGFHSHGKECTLLGKEEKRTKLLFIKLAILDSSVSESKVESYLQKVEEIVGKNTSKIENGGFVVVQTQDVRIGRYISPTAKKVVDILTSKNLWLKEIIVVTKDSCNHEIEKVDDNLKITHRYLLVYKVT